MGDTPDRRLGGPPIEAVLFDLDGTICAYRRPGSAVLSAAFGAADVTPFFSVEEYYARIDDHVAGTTTVDEGRERCFAALAREHDRDPAVGRAVARAYSAMRDHADVEPLAGAREAIEGLAAEYRVGLVTNGAPGMQSVKLEALSLGDRFETVVHAGYDPGIPSKPSPTPFRRALTALEVPAGRAVHIGNSVASDVAGAKAAGLRAVWLADGDVVDPEPAPDYVLSSLADLSPPPWRR